MLHHPKSEPAKGERKKEGKKGQKEKNTPHPKRKTQPAPIFSLSVQ